MLELLLAVLLGVLAGTFTGLIPGIHVNTISALVVSLSMSGTAIVVFIISLAITHTFIDVLPSIFLGAPDPSMVLSVLPGHELLREGRGFEAVQLTQLGSLGAVIISTSFFAGFVFLVKQVNTDWVPQVLLGLIFFLLLQTNWLGWFVFIIAGVFGWVVFHVPGLEQPLLPMLSGLFGISTLLLAKPGVIPEQKNTFFKTSLKPLFPAQIAGFLTAFMPGLGSAAAATLITPFVKVGREGFLVLVGSIGTVNFVLSLVTFYVLDRARNGAVVAVQQIANVSLELTLLALATIVLAGGLASLTLTKLTPLFARVAGSLDYVLLSRTVIVFLTIIIFLLSGFVGLIVAVVASALGVLAQLVGVPRSYWMDCISLPVLVYVMT